MPENELIDLGFSSNHDDNPRLRVLTSVSAPKAWSNGNMYLAVTFDKKLVKAAVISNDFIDDILGTKGKEAYQDIKNLLTRKYGSPSSTYERTGLKLYDDLDEFYQCLDYTGCGAYHSIYEIRGGTISVQLEGKRRGVGNLVITYESPFFTAAKQQIEQVNEITDDDAF